MIFCRLCSATAAGAKLKLDQNVTDYILFRQYKIRYLPQILHFICATLQNTHQKRAKALKEFAIFLLALPSLL